MSGPAGRTWQSIQAEVVRRINQRIWQPGDLIPGEVALAQEFGCARATVNRAMRALASAGLLDRRRKAGTRIALNPVRKATLDIPVTRLEIEGRGAAYRHVLIARRSGPPPPEVARRMGLGRSLPLLHLRAAHLADGQPFLYEDRWINPAAVPGVLDEDFSTISANEWLVQNAPFTAGDISFSAANADGEDAAHLNIAVGAAIFIVERTTRNGAQTITSVRLAYAPGFRMHTSL